MESVVLPSAQNMNDLHLFKLNDELVVSFFTLSQKTPNPLYNFRGTARRIAVQEEKGCQVIKSASQISLPSITCLTIAGTAPTATRQPLFNCHWLKHQHLEIYNSIFQKHENFDATFKCYPGLPVSSFSSVLKHFWDQANARTRRRSFAALEAHSARRHLYPGVCIRGISVVHTKQATCRQSAKFR